MKRYHLGGALAAFLCILPVAAGATDIGSGDYTRPINGPAELTGDITLNISGGSDAPLAALHAQAPSGAVTGSVRRLTIPCRRHGSHGGLAREPSSQRSGGHQYNGDRANGIWAYGPGASITLDGPVAVGTARGLLPRGIRLRHRRFRYGVGHPGPAHGDHTRDQGLWHLHVRRRRGRLGETHILTRGAGSDGIYALGGTLTLNRPPLPFG